MTIILHHYPASPFAELIRLALGLKGVPWRSVIIPNVMPKPDLVELTGGYARTPVLQIGADIHCDTAAICAALEAAQPSPSLYPAPLGALHKIIASWAAAAQFIAHVGATFGELPAGVLPPAFVADRKARFGLDIEQIGKAAPHLQSQALTSGAWLDGLLGDGRPFIGGDAPGHGDLALYSNIWFVRSVPVPTSVARAFDAYGRLAAWYERVAAIGHGTPEAMTEDEAIDVAAAADPAASPDTIVAPFSSQPVQVRTDGSGDTPVAGALARLGPDGITVLRDGERCGRVAVHFPRLGQMVVPG